MPQCNNCHKEYAYVGALDKHKSICISTNGHTVLPLTNGLLHSSISFKPVFSIFGKHILTTLTNLYPSNVLLIGPTGFGKSILVRAVAQTIGIDFTALNAHPGMDIAMLVGMWCPRSHNGGIAIEWKDGLLTAALRNPHAFLFEEFTRAPSEAMSRLFGLLDTSNRYWSIPEAGNPNVAIDPGFWFLATANPISVGYQSTRLDKALENRFTAIITINEPIADEYILLQQMSIPIIQINILLKFVADCRRNPNTYLNTRDVVTLGSLVVRGFSLMEAVSIGIAPKYLDHELGIIEVMKSLV